MESKELRLGNWVKHPDGYVQMESIRKGMSMEYLKPIEISPEILEKAGFDTTPVLFLSSNIWLNLDHDGGYNVFIKQRNNDESIDSILLDIQIEHLHQLQNLYFALTGTELEINL